MCSFVFIWLETTECFGFFFFISFFLPFFLSLRKKQNQQMGMFGKGKWLSNHERPGCVKWKSTYKETIWKARFISRYHQAFGFGEGIWKGWVSSDHRWLWGASLVPDVGTTVSSGGQSDGDWQHPRASGGKKLSILHLYNFTNIFYFRDIFVY